jgi:hypothetical protein
MSYVPPLASDLSLPQLPEVFLHSSAHAFSRSSSLNDSQDFAQLLQAWTQNAAARLDKLEPRENNSSVMRQAATQSFKAVVICCDEYLPPFLLQ